ncbi:MAG: GDSL-type esterase/lipase family protein, partial [Candidatus Phaeomarinobacter sp.]
MTSDRLRRVVSALALMLISAALMGAGQPQTTFVPISNPSGLSSFFDAKASGAGLRVLHIGDSHIARDTFSGDLRTLLNGGGKTGARGLLPAGTVYPFYLARGVEIDMSDGWEVVRARNEAASGPFGVMSARVEAEAGTSPWIAFSGFEMPVERLLIGYQRQPEGGALQILVDGKVHAVPTSGEAGAAFAAVPIGKGAQIVRLAAAGDGPVALFSVALEADGAGTVLSNAGWPGATAKIMARWDDDVLRMELQRLTPDLIIVSYGTNEGFDDDLDLDAYEAVLREQLDRLKAFAPQASLLLTGGPDGTRLPFYADTDTREPHEWTCAPLTDAERQDYVQLIADESETLLRWHDAPRLSALL